MTLLNILVEEFYIGRPHAPKEGEWSGWMIYATALIAAGCAGHLIFLGFWQ